MPKEKRISQRAPRACQQCSRQKLRCSQTIPCSRCVAKGKEKECSRETVSLSKEKNQVARLHEGEADAFTSTTYSLSPPERADGDGNSRMHRMGRTIAPSSERQTAPEESSGTLSEVQAAVREPDSLESLVWGSLETSASSHRTTGSVAGTVAADYITPEQEDAIIALHQEKIAWLHNVVHMPSFRAECLKSRASSHTTTASWHSFYFAMISSGFYYMNAEFCQGVGTGENMGQARLYYWKAIDALAAADFMSKHSLECLQAICVLVPCAHAFGDSKRIIVLLSSASCVAQLMRLYDLAAFPSRPHDQETVLRHELKKRVWCFLIIQDAYLITFKKTFSIIPLHATTPPPANCFEEALGDADNPEQIHLLPLSVPTQTTYMLLQLKLVSIKRRMFDSLFKEGCGQLPTGEQYNKILEADREMNTLRNDLPPWLKTSDSAALNSPSARSQWRTFRISYAHMMISIHRTFFCRSFANKQYCYSQAACMNAARMLLQTYRDTAAIDIVDGWTIPAHVISASIMVALKLLLSGDHDGFDLHSKKSSSEDEQLMSCCVESVAASSQSNQLVQRGRILIERLANYRKRRDVTSYALDNTMLADLADEVDVQIRGNDTATSSASNITFDDYFSLFINEDLFDFRTTGRLFDPGLPDT